MNRLNTTGTQRRQLMQAGLLGCATLPLASLASAASAAAKGPSETAGPGPALARMTEGPFYPPRSWRERWEDWDADLTRVARNNSELRARGEWMGLEARVVDTQGKALDQVEVEIWQCDAMQSYRHPSVNPSPAQFDPGFQGFGAARSDSQGRLRFLTIKPVPYPGRTPHIHVKLRHPSFGDLTSQLFVAGEPANARDFLWRRLDTEQQAALAMQLQPAAADSGLRWMAQQVLRVPA